MQDRHDMIDAIKGHINVLIGLIALVAMALLVYNKSDIRQDTEVQRQYLSAYDKLQAGEDISVLVVGDSIAEGTGASSGHSWAKMLPDKIKETYGSECTLTNVSMGGNASIAGITRINILDDDIDYDLAIICYGENDNDDWTFAPDYEGIIRALKIKYGNIDIISVLESSQRDYTNKMNQILTIAEYYNIPVADTIEAFNESGYEYDELVGAPDDLVHPNDLGHQIYMETVLDVIQSEVGSQRTYSDSVTKYDSYRYLAKEDFRKVGALSYEVQMDPVTAAIAIYRVFGPGDNSVTISVDGTVVAQESRDWPFSFTQAHIYPMTLEPVNLGGKLTVSFATKEAADSFIGIMLTNIQ